MGQGAKQVREEEKKKKKKLRWEGRKREGREGVKIKERRNVGRGGE